MPDASSPEIIDRLEAIDVRIRELRDLLLAQRTIRDHYGTEELAAILGKAEFTVREWCRLGRIRARKRGSGRGKHLGWVVAHDELLRIQREGLLPIKR